MVYTKRINFTVCEFDLNKFVIKEKVIERRGKGVGYRGGEEVMKKSFNLILKAMRDLHVKDGKQN